MSELTVVDQVPKPPSRPDDGHKGTFGTVIVVGGSPAMIGAPALCARAALRSGSGLVKIATTSDVLAFALTQVGLAELVEAISPFETKPDGTTRPFHP